MRIGRRAFVRSALVAAAGALAPPGSPWADDAVRATMSGDIPARTGSGQTLSLAAAEIEDFRARLRGPILLPHDAGYDAARRLWDPSFDRHPALIVRAHGAADVAQAVQFARSHALLTAVRGGGHSTTGQSSCDGGLMLDLSLMSGVRVDPTRRLARAQGGALLGEVDRATQAVGLATTLGTVTDTGIAGLTLGGGMGRLMRSFGLTCDNLVSVDIVTADGALRHASDAENPDLFWAVRGGGGNYGVVTTFEYRLHPLAHRVLGGTRIYPYRHARSVFRAAAELAERAPDELTLSVILANNPPGGGRGGVPIGHYVVVAVFYSGALRDAERVLEPLRSLGTPLKSRVTAESYLTAQGAVGTAPVAVPTDVASYMQTGFLDSTPEALFDELLRRFDATPLGLDCEVELAQMGGAVARVRPDATAYWNRAAAYDLFVNGSWSDPSQSDLNLRALDEVWKGVAGFTRGYYVNTSPGESEARVRATYGGNYARLVRLKDRYDPTNLFRLNSNIRPSGG